MRLLFVRHASAVPAVAGRPDAERRLTPKGKRRFAETATALAGALPKPNAIWSSPARRARQTAKLAARAWGGPLPQVTPILLDGSWAEIGRLLAPYGSDDTVVVVGHEGWLSEITARLLGSSSSASFRYRKGGAALLETADFTPGRAHLLWRTTPRLLRRLRK